MMRFLGTWMMAGGALVGLLVSPSAAQIPICDPAAECCVEDCPADPMLPSTESCIDDPCGCARAIDCTITALEDEGALTLYPTTSEMELNTASSHGTYITMRVNDLALGTINEKLVDRQGPVDFPYGSIISKENFLPVGNPEPPFRTSMVKLEGFCLEEAASGRGCNGGEWFWMIRRFGRYPFIADGGKTSFCTGCHAAAEKSDWSWRLFTRRRFPAPDQEVAR